MNISGITVSLLTFGTTVHDAHNFARRVNHAPHVGHSPANSKCQYSGWVGKPKKTTSFEDEPFVGRS